MPRRFKPNLAREQLLADLLLFVLGVLICAGGIAFAATVPARIAGGAILLVYVVLIGLLYRRVRR